MNTCKLNANMTSHEKRLQGKLCYSPTRLPKPSLDVDLRRPFTGPETQHIIYSTRWPLCSSNFDADQNTSSTLNLTGLLALRRLLALASRRRKKKGCRINFHFAKTGGPKSSARQLGREVSILVPFFFPSPYKQLYK